MAVGSQRPEAPVEQTIGSPRSRQDACRWHLAVTLSMASGGLDGGGAETGLSSRDVPAAPTGGSLRMRLAATVAVPGARTCAIEVNSLSKYAGFTGVRLGWTVVPKELTFADGTSGVSDRVIAHFADVRCASLPLSLISSS